MTKPHCLYFEYWKDRFVLKIPRGRMLGLGVAALVLSNPVPSTLNIFDQSRLTY